MILRHWPSAWTWLSTVLSVVERRALRRQQLVVHRQEMLADDVQARVRHQMMDVGDAAGDRILDRDHAELGLARCAPPRRRPRRSRRAAARSPDRPRGRRGANWRPARPGMRSSSCSSWLLSSRSLLNCQRQRPSSARARLEVLGRIDAERHRCRRCATSMRMPASSARNCSSFSRCSSGEGGSVDEALQRRAAIGVEADVMIERPVAGRRGGAGEIERAQPAAARPASRPPSPRSGLVRSSVSHDLGRQRGDVDRRIGERRERGARCRPGSMRRQVALHVDDDVVRGRPDRRMPSASKMRSEPETWSARVMTARPPAFSTAAAMASRIGRDHHRADPGRLGAPQHMHDHRHAGDIGQRLAGQPGRGHAGRNQDQDVVGHGHRMAVRGSASRPKRQNAPMVAPRYTGCQRRGKPVISAPPRASRGSARCRLVRAAEPIRDGLLRTQQDHGRRARHLPRPAVAQHRRRRDLSSAPRRPSPATRSRCRSSAGRRARRRRAAAGRADRGAASPAPMSAAARPRPRNASPATPSTRAGRTGSARISTASSAAHKASVPGFNYSAAMKAQGRQLDARGLDDYLDQSARPWSPAPT